MILWLVWVIKQECCSLYKWLMGYGNFLCGIKLGYEICFGEWYKTQVILHTSAKEYCALLKTGLGILDFLHFDWLNGARLSAHNLLRPNVVNEHSTTTWAERFFLASDSAIKIDEKNHLAANLNQAEIPTASPQSTTNSVV